MATMSMIIYAINEDSTAFPTKPFQGSLFCSLSMNMANRPYNIKLIIMAPVNAEYLARGPNVPTACDSNCPGVSANKVWDASSGIKGPPAYDRIIRDIAIATAPAASPPTNEMVEFVPDFSITHMA